MSKVEKTTNIPDSLQAAESEYKKYCEAYEKLVQRVKNNPPKDKNSFNSLTEECRKALQAKRDSAKIIEDIKLNKVQE